MTKRQPEPQAGTWGLQAPTSSPTGDICRGCRGPLGLASDTQGSAPCPGHLCRAQGPWTPATGSLTRACGLGHGQPLGPARGRVPTCPALLLLVLPHGGAQRASTGPTARSRGRLEGHLSSRSRRRCCSPIQATCPAGCGQVC